MIISDGLEIQVTQINATKSVFRLDINRFEMTSFFKANKNTELNEFACLK